MSDGFERVYLCHVGHEDDEYGTDKVKAALGARMPRLPHRQVNRRDAAQST